MTTTNFWFLEPLFSIIDSQSPYGGAHLSAMPLLVRASTKSRSSRCNSRDSVICMNGVVAGKG